MHKTAIKQYVPRTDTILNRLRRSGYAAGWCREWIDGRLLVRANAMHTRSGVKWSVSAPTAFEAVAQLALVLGCDCDE